MMQIWMVFNIYKYLLLTHYLMSGCLYTVDGLVCFVTQMADPNEGGRLRWAVPITMITQGRACTRVFASPVGKHMMYPPAPTDKCCIDGCDEVHSTQMWFEDDIPSFLNQTIADETSTSSLSTALTTVSKSDETSASSLTTTVTTVAKSESLTSATVSTQPIIGTTIGSYAAPETNLTASNDNAGQNYSGCFINGSPLIFPTSNLISNPFMTREVCFGHCQSRNMKYASVHYIYCSCGPDGHNFNIYGQVAAERCSFRCPGNYEQYCGGADAEYPILASIFELTNMTVDCGTPSSWTYFNGSCYQEVFTNVVTRYTWDNAKTECENLALGAHLVVINSKQENDFIRGFGLTPPHEAIWLGCSDGSTEGQWVCLDGSGNTYDRTTQSGIGFWGQSQNDARYGS
ncbi:uncharacterized protein [Amphiura filiformis]|uniref:uncharacterized protein n=1 Tax=Amphiura filiformis TaxID=82378 RepID=UPI003B21539E